MNQKKTFSGNAWALAFEESGKEPLSGGLGAVLASAGTGKTPFLVQIALNSLIQGKNVLHVGMDETVRKICLWYDEVFNNISLQEQEDPHADPWEAMLPHRFIMTFSSQSFSPALLEERIQELSEQGIFYPQVIILDGMPVDENLREGLIKIKKLAEDMRFTAWLALCTEAENAGELPVFFRETKDLFDTALCLKPENNHMNIMDLMEDNNNSGKWILDPATFLIKSS